MDDVIAEIRAVCLAGVVIGLVSPDDLEAGVHEPEV
jgi:hypothetical protein